MDTHCFAIVRLLMSASLLALISFSSYLGIALLCICLAENTKLRNYVVFPHILQRNINFWQLCTSSRALPPSTFHIELFYISVPVFSWRAFVKHNQKHPFLPTLYSFWSIFFSLLQSKFIIIIIRLTNIMFWFFLLFQTHSTEEFTLDSLSLKFNPKGIYRGRWTSAWLVWNIG